MPQWAWTIKNTTNVVDIIRDFYALYVNTFSHKSQDKFFKPAEIWEILHTYFITIDQ